MITGFEIVQNNKKLALDSATVSRLLNYDLFRDLYDGNFKIQLSGNKAVKCKRKIFTPSSRRN